MCPLPLLTCPGLPGWLPAWGLVSAEPEDGAHGSPPGKIILLAENMANFPLNTVRPGHAVGEARLQTAQGSGELGLGWAPAAPSPPHGARGPAPPQAPATTPTSPAQLDLGHQIAAEPGRPVPIDTRTPQMSRPPGTTHAWPGQLLRLTAHPRLDFQHRRVHGVVATVPGTGRRPAPVCIRSITPVSGLPKSRLIPVLRLITGIP